MKNWIRPTALVLVLALVPWANDVVPGYRLSEPRGFGFSWGGFLVTVVDPLVLLAAVGSALLFGGWRGVLGGARFLLGGRGPKSDADRKAAGRAILAAARAGLWGSCALSAVYVISFYWPLPPHESTGWFDGAPKRIRFVQNAAFLPAAWGALVLLPSGEGLVRSAKDRWRTLHCVDGIALAGLLTCSMAVLLSILVYKHPVIGSEGSAQAYILPTTTTIDVAFVSWCAMAVAGLTWLASTVRGASRAPETEHGSNGPSAGLFDGRTLMGAAVFVAVLVQVAGLTQIASAGGQADPGPLQELGGRMLVPLAIALLLSAGLRLVGGARAPKLAQSTA